LVFTRRAYFLVVRAIGFDLAQVSCATEAVFEICGSHEAGDSLVKPEVVPIATGDHVSPPLMRKLMRSEPNVLLVVQHFLSIRFPQSCETIHFLFDTAGCQDLCVRLAGILNTRAFFVEVQHVGCVAEDAAHFIRGVVCREVLKLYLSMFLFDDVKGTGSKTEDVGWNRRALSPFGDTSTVWQFVLGNEFAVCYWR